MSIRILIVILSMLSGGLALADTIAVIGTGNVGMALGTEFAQQGHTIIYGSRSPAGSKALDLVAKTKGDAAAATPSNAAAQAEIVVLAVPGLVVEDVVRELGDLSDKIIIDATNPLVSNEALEFSMGVETSNGEIVQAAAPGAKVVKAFNTITWQAMIDPDASGGPVHVPLVGNDASAKATVAELVSKMGLVPFDIGPIETARWTEMAIVVILNNRFSDRDEFTLLFREVQ